MSKREIIAVRNAILKAATGRVLGDVMQGIIMAQATIAVSQCDGDEQKAGELLDHFYSIMMAAVPTYCADPSNRYGTMQ